MTMKQLHQLMRGEVYINSTGTKFGFSDYPVLDSKISKIHLHLNAQNFTLDKLLPVY